MEGHFTEVTTWTPERTEALRTLHGLGEFTTRQIADRLGLTKNQVIGKIQRIGLAETKPATKWTDEKVAKLRLMYARGDSYPVIGAALGLSTRTIENKAKKLRLAAEFGGRKPGGKPGQKPKAVSATQYMTPAERLAYRREQAARYIAAANEAPHADFLNITFDQLNLFSRKYANRCRYPRGDGAAMRFCGQTTPPGKAYCPHCFIVTVRGVQ